MEWEGADCMKRAGIIIACGLLLCITLAAQEESEYQEVMEEANQTTGSLALNLQAKDATAALADSKKLYALFGQIYVFFEKRNVADAMQFAKAAQQGFKEVGELAAAGNMADALAKFQATRSNCDGCHQAHREKTPQGDWKIKY
jgi:hypothetical protein